VACGGAIDVRSNGTQMNRLHTGQNTFSAADAQTRLVLCFTIPKTRSDDSSPHAQLCPPGSTYRLAVEVATCLTPSMTIGSSADRGVRKARTAATKNSANTSPQRCPIWSACMKDCSAIIPAWTTLDHTVNQMRLKCAPGLRLAIKRKTPNVAYTPKIIAG
jgi:hypothetical protein